MDKILYYAVMLLEASPPNQLFNDGEVSETLRTLVCSEYTSRDVFYGRCLGFQVRLHVYMLQLHVCMVQHNIVHSRAATWSNYE